MARSVTHWPVGRSSAYGHTTRSLHRRPLSSARWSRTTGRRWRRSTGTGCGTASRPSRPRGHAGTPGMRGVYAAREARGLGIGRTLLEALIAGAEAAGIWTIQTSVFPENRPSLALQRACGFRIVGTRERIAKRDGVWRETVFLERRSEVVT